MNIKGKLFKAVSFNARSFRNKLTSIMTYLEENNIDLAFIQETWMRKSDGHLVSQIKEYGYEFIGYRKKRRLDLGGGVALIHRNNLNIRNVKSNHYNSFEHTLCKISTDLGPINFINVYRPEYSAKNRYTVNMFLKDFSDMMSVIASDPYPCYIVGDFNLHVELVGNVIPTPNVDPELTQSRQVKQKDATLFLDLIHDSNFTQTITSETHDQHGTLDLLMTHSDNIPTIQNIEIGLKNEICESDHFMIKFDLTLKPVRQSEMIEIIKRDFNALSTSTFCERLRTDDPLSDFETLGLNDSVLLYESVLSNILNDLCPFQKIITRKRPRQKWFNDQLRVIKRRKRAIERKWKNHPSAYWANELKLVKQEYKTSLCSARSTFYKNTLDNSNGDTKSIFKTVKYLTGNQQDHVHPLCNDKLHLANDMASYFDKKIQNIRKDLEGSDCNSCLDLSSDRPKCTFEKFQSVSMDELKKIALSMNPKSSPHDPLPAWFIKEHIDDFLPLLHVLVNRSFSENEFPLALKHAIVTPIIKDPDGDRESYKNYRPVSNLTFLSKLIEKCASSQLHSYLQSNGLYPEYQSAYRKGHSCETALLKIVDDIQHEIYQRKMVALVMLDLSSAFDTIDHKELGKKLSNDFGITGNAHIWFDSYLKNRSFSVRIGNLNGKRVLLIYGVPQGSILGPLLFILYIHDLVEVAKCFGLQIHLYADDSQIYFGFSPLNESTLSMNLIKDCLMEVHLWMTKNFLKLNLDKTEVMFFGRQQEMSLFDVSIDVDGEVFCSNSTVTVKTLGIYLDSNLSMDANVSRCISSAYCNLKSLQSIRHCLDISKKTLLVTSLVLSRLDYCNILLANTSSGNIRKLQRVLNACVRFIFSLRKRDKGITEFAKKCHFLPVKQRIIFKSCVTVFKSLNGLAPDYLAPMINYNFPTRDNLRSGNDVTILRLPICNKTLQYAMIDNWNNLPVTLRYETSLNQFKTNLKTHLFRIAYGL